MQVKQVRKSMYLMGVASLSLLATSTLRAQNLGNQTANEEKGPTASVVVSGNSTSVSGGLSFDPSVGMNFTKNFGVDVGVPYFLYTRPGIFASTAGRNGYVSYPFVGCTFFFGCYTGVTTSSRMWAGELGDVYVDAHYTRPYRQYNLATVLTADTPTASYRKGLTTGRLQWDWFNHVDTDIHGFSPFVNFGLANGRMDQHFLPRPYNTLLPFRTLGYMADFEGGVQYKIWRRFTAGFSVWDVLPMGPQKIYSDLVWQGPNGTTTGAGAVIVPSAPVATVNYPGSIGFLSGDPNHGRYWNTAFYTAGPSSIARDNGYSATVAFSPYKNLDCQIGYNHSVRYKLDAVTFTVAFNANSLFRKLTNY